ncbi:(2Fe-2S)-binding protein [Variovorax paradoxus]|jgi:carbon-monoxide dehydrogenase small subunit|uniref:(2Fe-2S)-binding protein n=1 Tax=Variovorax paradoxus TaxID=34073 RepID=UPI003ED0E455
MSRNLEFELNGKTCRRDVEPNTLLKDMLRLDLGMTGTKETCGEGICGACTVLVNGMPVRSCLVLAMQVGNHSVETIEGIGNAQNLHPLQQAFLEHGAFQCGWCTPGMIMTAKALLAANPDPSEAEIRDAIRGNLCRCTGYVKIVEAIQAAAATARGSNPLAQSQ